MSNGRLATADVDFCIEWLRNNYQAHATIDDLCAQMKVDFLNAQEPSHCDIPPSGWRCTRAPGHEGPCAAVDAREDMALIQRGLDRVNAA